MTPSKRQKALDDWLRQYQLLDRLTKLLESGEDIEDFVLFAIAQEERRRKPVTI